MSVRLITPPTIEPVTVAEIRLVCRIDSTGDALFDTQVDADILADISAMRKLAEHRTGRSLMPQTWEVALDAFPSAEISLPNPIVTSITSVKYISAETGTEVTLASNQYSLDDAREYEAWLNPAVDIVWPNTADVANAVRVRYVAGYANAAAVPPNVKKWIKSAVKFSRDGGCDGAGELPYDFNQSLLDSIKAYT
jgi:uncharacterized phiE125 gp8 family phage protein